MYIDRVRVAIARLDDNSFKEYLTKLRYLLKAKYNKDVKPSQLKLRVKSFIDGKASDLDYFEAYLITFDKLYDNGALNILEGDESEIQKAWRKVLIYVTKDQAPSKEIIHHLNDAEILKQIKGCFYNSINYCKDEKKGQFYENLHKFNQFLDINKHKH